MYTVYQTKYPIIYFALQEGWTPLHYAALNGHVNVIEILNSQANINATTNVRKNLRL